MHCDNEQIQIEFHNRANAIFFIQLDEFDRAVRQMDRKTREYEFQRVKETHVHTLKQQLENCALALMRAHRNNRNEGELSQNLQHYIGQYLYFFTQKARRD